MPAVVLFQALSDNPDCFISGNAGKKLIADQWLQTLDV